MRAATWVAAITGLCVMGAANAEPMYVIEQLIVNINSTPDGTGDRVASIRSGDKVELIERRADQSLVRLSSGSEGWVRSSYLSAEPPLRQRLDDRTQELDKALRRVGQLEGELSEAQAKLVAATRPSTAETPRATSPSAAPAARARELSRPVFPDSDASAARPAWRWVVLGSVISLIVGFALGWRSLDRRIRRKYGGLRIY
jgi:hypothetical protein